MKLSKNIMIGITTVSTVMSIVVVINHVAKVRQLAANPASGPPTISHNVLAEQTRRPRTSVVYVFDGEAALYQRQIAKARAQIAAGHLEYVVYYPAGLEASKRAQRLAEIEVQLYKELGIDAHAQPSQDIVYPAWAYGYEQEMKTAIEKKLGINHQQRIKKLAEAQMQ